MDIQLQPKHWAIRYKYYIVAGVAILTLVVYAVTLSAGPTRQRVSRNSITIQEVRHAPFSEYVEAEGLTQPIRTLKVNTREEGYVLRIVAEEGQTVRQGDTILLLANPELQRNIDDQRDELERQQNSYAQQLLDQEKLRLSLQKQLLEASYNQQRQEKNIALERSEHQLGIRSKAQLEMSEADYKYQQQRTALDLLSLRSDSAAAELRSQMLAHDMAREQKKFLRTCRRLDDLVVTAPCDGQVSNISAALGQRVSAGMTIAEVKQLSDFKIHAALSEYYIDRILVGLPAQIRYQDSLYPLHISRVVPEVHDRQFNIDLTFDDRRPANIRVGKSYQVRIELGNSEEALIVPRGNFYSHTNGRWLYKLDDSGEKATRVPVTLGRQSPSLFEVLDGLHPGDQVIVTGYDQMGQADVILIE